MSLLGSIVVGMITFGAWCMVGIASLIIQVWLFTFHDYAAWLGARRIADGTIEFNENVIVAVQPILDGWKGVIEDSVFPTENSQSYYRHSK